MATHSSVLAWRIPGTGEPGDCRLWGRTELDTTEVTEHSIARDPQGMGAPMLVLMVVYSVCSYVSWSFGGP